MANEIEKKSLPKDSRRYLLEMMAESKKLSPEDQGAFMQEEIVPIWKDLESRYLMDADSAMVKTGIDLGLRAMDYTSGLTRTGAYALGGQVTKQDLIDALKGRAPGSSEQLARLGMKEGALRSAVGFGSDVLLSPGMLGGMAKGTAKGMGYLGNKLTAKELRDAAKQATKESAAKVEKTMTLPGKAKEWLRENLPRAMEAFALGEGPTQTTRKIGQKVFTHPNLKSVDIAAEEAGKLPVSQIAQKYGHIGDTTDIPAEVRNVATHLTTVRNNLVNKLSTPGKTQIKIDDIFSDPETLDLVSQYIPLKPGLRDVVNMEEAVKKGGFTIAEAQGVKQALDEITAGTNKGFDLVAPAAGGQDAASSFIGKIANVEPFKESGKSARKAVENVADDLQRGAGGDIYSLNKEIAPLVDPRIKKAVSGAAKRSTLGSMVTPGLVLGGAGLASSAATGMNVDPKTLGLAVIGGMLSATPTGRTLWGQLLKRGAQPIARVPSVMGIGVKREQDPWSLLQEQAAMQGEGELK